MAVERKTRWHYLYFRFIKIASGMLVSTDRKIRVVATDTSSGLCESGSRPYKHK